MKLVKMNQKLHNPDSPLLIEDVKDGETVKEISEPSYIDTQTRLFRLIVLSNAIFHGIIIFFDKLFIILFRYYLLVII